MEKKLDREKIKSAYECLMQAAYNYRDNTLIPSLLNNGRIVIKLDDAPELPNYWLAEVFWGLSDRLKETPKELLKRIVFISDEEDDLSNKIKKLIQKEAVD